MNLSKNKRLTCGAITAFVTFLIINYCFYKANIAPLGKNSILLSDLATQYSSYLVFLRNSTWAEKMFSLTKGFGGQTLGLLSYYTNSVFNLILFLFPPQKVELALYFITTARFVFMALCMYIYLSHHSDNFVADIPFAVIYATSPWFIGNYYNVLWTDCFALLPLLILGTEKTVYNRDRKLFVAVFTYMLFSNYYMAFIAAVFVIMWYFVLIVKEKFDFKKCCTSFVDMAHNAVISAMLVAPVLVSSRFSLLGGKLGDDAIQSWHNVKRWDYRLLPTLLFEQNWFSEAFPRFTGCVLCIFLAVTYFVGTRYSAKEKIADFCLMAVVLAGMIVRPLSYMWTCFSAPQGFHFRQMFVFAFLLVVLCRKGFDSINTASSVRTFAIMAMAYVAGMMFYKNHPDLSWNPHTIYITAFSLVLTVAGYVAMAKIGKKTAPLFATAIIFMATGQATFFMPKVSQPDSGDVIFGSYNGTFEKNYLDTQNAISNIGDDSFCRIDDLAQWSRNQAMQLGYNSVSHYSSVFDQNQKDMFIHFGYDDTYYSTTYNHSYPLSDALFGIKYVLGDENSTVSRLYTLVCDGEKDVYFNPYYLPVFFTGNTAQVEYSEDWPMHINNMLVALTGTDILMEDGNADYEKLLSAAELIRENAVQVTENNGNKILLSAPRSENGYLLSTIMYDRNWKVIVNGKEVQPVAFMEWFMAVPLEKGAENIIKLEYTPKGLVTGIAVMFAGIIAEGLYITITKKNHSL